MQTKDQPGRLQHMMVVSEWLVQYILVYSLLARQCRCLLPVNYLQVSFHMSLFVQAIIARDESYHPGYAYMLRRTCRAQVTMS